MNHDDMLTTGQMAQIFRINKKTLMYYDEIGLFSPSMRSENDYRYYSYNQILTLAVILTLRESGTSIADLKDLFQKRSVESLISLLHHEKAKMKERITNLETSIRFIEHISSVLNDALSAPIGEISVVPMREIPILLCPIDGHDVIEETKSFFYRLSLQNRSGFHFYAFGSVVTMQRILARQFAEYSCLYAIIDAEGATDQYDLRPAGKYLTLYWKGAWESLPKAYEKMLSYAAIHNYSIAGDAYEENLIDTFTTDNEDEYITKILIPIL